VLTADLLPDRIRGTHSAPTDAPLPLFQPGMTLSAVEREHIANTLALTGGNKKRTAEVLGISRRALYNKLERYQLL
jgi:DNA-binding NtrC family response regulator